MWFLRQELRVFTFQVCSIWRKWGGLSDQPSSMCVKYVFGGQFVCETNRIYSTSSILCDGFRLLESCLLTSIFCFLLLPTHHDYSNKQDPDFQGFGFTLGRCKLSPTFITMIFTATPRVVSVSLSLQAMPLRILLRWMDLWTHIYLVPINDKQVLSWQP